MSPGHLPVHSFDNRFVYPTYLEMPTSSRAGYIWAWVVIGAIAVTVPVLGFLRWHNHVMLGTFTLLGICIALVPLAMKAIYSILLSWAQFLPTFLRKDSATSSHYEQWIRHEFERLNSSSVPRLFGMGFAALAVSAFWLGGAFDKLPAVMLASRLSGNCASVQLCMWSWSCSGLFSRAVHLAPGPRVPRSGFGT